MFKIFEIFDLWYNPATIVENPFKGKAPKKKSLRTQISDIRYTESGVGLIQQDTDDGFEAEVFTGQPTDRSPHFTTADAQLIEQRSLKEGKYRKLKPFWSKGWSAKKTAEHFSYRGIGGFSQRLIDTYFAAMNSNPSPIDEKRGEARSETAILT